MKSYSCIVEGTVAGGNFQPWVVKLAQELDLKGWVRNIAEQKAEILVQGSAEAYAVFRDRLKAESPVPNMIGVSCTALDYDKVHDHFELRG